jgi:putative oxidoreductase
MIMKYLSRFKGYSPLVLRFIFLLYFILALQAKVYSGEAINAFSEQLAGLGFPIPLFFAFVGTWMVLIAYLLIVIGWQVRWAAIPIVIYFLVAIVTYHLPNNHSISKTMPAIVLLMLGLFFLLNGAGKWSIDEGR